MNAPIVTAGGGRAELRAGATDISERRRSGVSRGPLIDLVSRPETRGIVWSDDGAARIGALTTVAAIAADARIAVAYPGLAAAAAGLATPQIRQRATLGGNLAQRLRCWYFRNPDIACLKKGGAHCPARNGNHLYGVAFDLGPCIAPHPSTLAAALLAYDAVATTDRRSGLGIDELLGDGSDGTADHTLQPGEIIESVVLPPPAEGERAIYKRAISRTHAEWPLVEIVARAIVAEGMFRLLRLSAGGIAPVPLRLRGAEAAGNGAKTDDATIAAVVARCVDGAKPLPMTAYKLDLLKGLVQDALGRLVSSEKRP